MSTFFITAIVTFFVSIVVVILMAFGVLAGRKPIAGSCGGLGNDCKICGGDSTQCKER